MGSAKGGDRAALVAALRNLVAGVAVDELSHVLHWAPACTMKDRFLCMPDKWKCDIVG